MALEGELSLCCSRCHDHIYQRIRTDGDIIISLQKALKPTGCCGTNFANPVLLPVLFMLMEVVQKNLAFTTPASGIKSEEM